MASSTFLKPGVCKFLAHTPAEWWFSPHSEYLKILKISIIKYRFRDLSRVALKQMHIGNNDDLGWSNYTYEVRVKVY